MKTEKFQNKSAQKFDSGKIIFFSESMGGAPQALTEVQAKISEGMELMEGNENEQELQRRVQRINRIVQRASSQEESVRKEVTTFIRDSVRGEIDSLGIPMINFDVDMEEGLSGSEFERYSNYLETAVDRIISPTFNTALDRYEDIQDKRLALDMAIARPADFKKLVELGLPLETIENRIKAIDELRRAQRMVTGRAHGSPRQNNNLVQQNQFRECGNIDTMIRNLLNERSLGNQNITTRFVSWGPGGRSENYKTWFSDQIPAAEFMARITTSRMAAKVFGEHYNEGIREVEIAKDDGPKIERLRTLLERIESANPASKLKNALIEAQGLLDLGQFNMACNKLNEEIFTEIRALRDQRAQDLGENAANLGRALRSLGDTEGATEEMIRAAVEESDVNESPEIVENINEMETQIERELENEVEGLASELYEMASNRFTEIMRVLGDSPEASHQTSQLLRNRDKIIETIIALEIQSRAVNKYINENASRVMGTLPQNAPQILREYANMTGAGALRFTDRAWQITKEVAIAIVGMAVGTVIPAGMAAIAGMIGARAMLLATRIRNAARTIQTIQKSSRGVSASRAGENMGDKVIAENRQLPGTRTGT